MYRQQKALLFGPFAGFSPKFLKTGSNLDLIGSVKPNMRLNDVSCWCKRNGINKILNSASYVIT
ncbi:malate:quinone oxidoreductase [Bacillus cereus]